MQGEAQGGYLSKSGYVNDRQVFCTKAGVKWQPKSVASYGLIIGDESGDVGESGLMESVCGDAKGAGVGNCLACVMQHAQLEGCALAADSFCSGH